MGAHRRTCLRAACGAALLGLWPVLRAEPPVLRDWPVRQPTPALDALDLQGQRWQLAGLRGQPVLLNFWASWCAPCLVEMPTLIQLADFHGPQALRVLTVNFKEPTSRVRRVAQSMGLHLPVLLDPLGDVARAWGVTVFPTTVLIDRQGRARHVVRGEVDWTDAEALGWVDRLLG